VSGREVFGTGTEEDPFQKALTQALGFLADDTRRRA